MTFPALKLYLLNVLYSLGVLGPWAVIPIYAVAMSSFISVAFLGLAAGAMFGVVSGFLVLSISSAVSAGLLFLAGRYLAGARGWVFKKIAASEKVRAIDDAVAKGGWRMVALLRQTAFLPFTVMNYGLGLSKIPFRDYLLATWVSMMPGCLMYAYLGSLAGEMLFEGHKPERTTLEWVFFALSLTTTIGLGFYATKRVRKLLDEKIETG